MGSKRIKPLVNQSGSRRFPTIPRHSEPNHYAVRLVSSTQALDPSAQTTHALAFIMFIMKFGSFFGDFTATHARVNR